MLPVSELVPASAIIEHIVFYLFFLSEMEPHSFYKNKKGKDRKDNMIANARSINWERAKQRVEEEKKKVISSQTLSM